MKLRELFDKMTPGMLDMHVTVRLEKAYEQYDGYDVHKGNVINRRITSSTYRPIERVEIEDNGSVTLVVEE